MASFQKQEPRNNRIIVFKGKKGWRWKAITRNGNNVANSSEDYGPDKGKAARAAAKFGPDGFSVWVKENGGYTQATVTKKVTY